MTSRPASVYFPGLNGIRAIAACGVMLSHTLIAMHHFGGTARYAGGLDIAGQGVIIFFTLSGFLITYLLLEEKQTCGDIDFRGFYLRRILRIWPLYFFYIAVAMGYHALVEPGGATDAPYVLLFIFFLPNIAFNLGHYMPDTAPLWSIGIEEQFYAMWPLVVSRIRRLRVFLVTLIVGLLALRFAMHAVNGHGKHLSTSIVDSLGYDSMAIGALVAILYRAKHPLLLRIADTWVPHLAFAALVALHATNHLRFLSLLATPVTGVITGVFIVAQITGTRKLLDLENPVLNYLGKISFGIYVYHSLVITVVARVEKDVLGLSSLPAPVAVATVAAVTIGVASLSYRYLERPFLRRKDSLARVNTARAT